MIRLISIAPEAWGAVGVIGAAIITAVASLLAKGGKKRKENNGSLTTSMPQNQSKVSRIDKSTIRILFIDDEKFENVSVLKNAGWMNTKSIKDIKRIDSPEIQNSDVIFVDINGVGTALFPKEQGLGVAAQIKKQFPKKYVVVYSAQPQQLHSSFSHVDAILPKNAEPYEYLSVLETYLEQVI